MSAQEVVNRVDTKFDTEMPIGTKKNSAIANSARFQGQANENILQIWDATRHNTMRRLRVIVGAAQ